MNLEIRPEFCETAKGLLVPRRLARQHFTGVDLFAGCGGMSLGFIQAGCRVLAAVDNDPQAALVYMMNLGSYPCQFHFVEPSDRERLEAVLERYAKPRRKGNAIAVFPTAGSGWIRTRPDLPGVRHFFLGDIRKLSGRQILEAIGLEVGELGCLFGGPPCQGFSVVGRRNVMDPRNSLIFEFARLVLEIRPLTVVMENVPGLASMVTPEGLPVLEAFGQMLEKGEWAEAAIIRRALASHPDARAILRTPKKAKVSNQGSRQERSEVGPLFAVR